MANLMNPMKKKGIPKRKKTEKRSKTRRIDDVGHVP